MQGRRRRWSLTPRGPCNLERSWLPIAQIVGCWPIPSFGIQLRTRAPGLPLRQRGENPSYLFGGYRPRMAHDSSVLDVRRSLIFEICSSISAGSMETNWETGNETNRSETNAETGQRETQRRRNGRNRNAGCEKHVARPRRRGARAQQGLRKQRENKSQALEGQTKRRANDNRDDTTPGQR